MTQYKAGDTVTPYSDDDMRAITADSRSYSKLWIDWKQLEDECERLRGSWRCFHCDAVFTDRDSAAEHFGVDETRQPACQIDIAEYRRMEAINARHVDEDTDLHRTIYAMQTKHIDELRRAEESGYAKGLKDYQKLADQLAAIHAQEVVGWQYADLSSTHWQPISKESAAILGDVFPVRELIVRPVKPEKASG